MRRWLTALTSAAVVAAPVVAQQVNTHKPGYVVVRVKMSSDGGGTGTGNTSGDSDHRARRAFNVRGAQTVLTAAAAGRVGRVVEAWEVAAITKPRRRLWMVRSSLPRDAA